MRLRALYVRYADGDDDRYRVVVRTGANDDGNDIEVTTLAAYVAFRARHHDLCNWDADAKRQALRARSR